MSKAGWALWVVILILVAGAAIERQFPGSQSHSASEPAQVVEVCGPRPASFTPFTDGSQTVRRAQDGTIVDCNDRTTRPEYVELANPDADPGGDGFFNP